eukprot:553052_1
MMESYTWKIRDKALITKIKNAKPGQTFTSPTFRLCNLTFELQLYPNGQSETPGNVLIYLFMCGLSPKIHSIVLQRKYMLIEMDAENSRSNTIKQDKMYCEGWGVGMVKTSDLQKLTQMTFKIGITLCNVFDKDGEDITHKYLKKIECKTEDAISTVDQQLNSAKLDSVIMQIEKLNATIQTIQQEVNDLKLRMKEEEKNPYDDRFDKLEKEIKVIKQTMSKLSLNSNINPEQQKLKLWFEKKLKLPEYYDVFIENGIEDLSTVSLLTMDSLKAMGID